MVELLGSVIKDERRHYAFYRSQAQMRLAKSKRARMLARWTMERLWAPVGTGVRPQEETDFVVDYLMGNESGLAAARMMDETLSDLPGLGGLTLIQKAGADVAKRVDAVQSEFSSNSGLAP